MLWINPLEVIQQKDSYMNFIFEIFVSSKRKKEKEGKKKKKRRRKKRKKEPF